MLLKYRTERIGDSTSADYGTVEKDEEQPVRAVRSSFLPLEAGVILGRRSTVNSGIANKTVERYHCTQFHSTGGCGYSNHAIDHAKAVDYYIETHRDHHNARLSLMQCQSIKLIKPRFP